MGQVSACPIFTFAQLFTREQQTSFRLRYGPAAAAFAEDHHVGRIAADPATG
jgi:hypothetical protein